MVYDPIHIGGNCSAVIFSAELAVANRGGFHCGFKAFLVVSASFRKGSYGRQQRYSPLIVRRKQRKLLFGLAELILLQPFEPCELVMVMPGAGLDLQRI